MTTFVGVRNMAHWVQRVGVENILSGMVETLDEDFRRWSEFDKTPRVASHTPFGVIELMPTSDLDTYSFKYVNGHPANPACGFQTVTAFGMLADVHNGYPRFVAEMTLLTALRTAATSALVTRELAPAGASTMALVGAGSQSEFQALGIRATLGIEDLRVFDTDPVAVEKLQRNLEPLGFRITVADSVGEAVANSDIITTCIADKAHTIALPDDCVGKGVHINGVGGDCPGKTELDPELVRRSNVFVEYPEQTKIEGEIQLQPEDFPTTEIWKVLVGDAPGRTSDDEITLFDSVGFAIADFSALRYVEAATRDPEYHEDIDLIAEPGDPKDLFSLIGAGVPA